MNEEIKDEKQKLDLAPMIPKSILDLSKNDRMDFVNNVKTALKEGHLEPLRVNTFVKQLETLAKNFTEDKEYKEIILDEAKKYGKGTHEYGNTSFFIKESGVSYDFESCGDPVYNELKEKLEQRKKQLLALPKEGEDTLLPGGEVKKLFPPVKKSTTIVQTSLK